MTTKVDNGPYSLTGDENTSPAREVTQLADLIRTNGHFSVVFVTNITGKPGVVGGTTICDDEDVLPGVNRAVERLRRRLQLRGAPVGIGDLKHMVLGHVYDERDYRARAEICVELESDVIHFTKAPWHPDNCPGGKESPRLIEMVKRGKPFTASYVFDNRRDASYFDSNGTIEDRVYRLLAPLGLSTEAQVIHQDWPFEFGQGKRRIDIRIEPKSK